ncbi:MAG: DUF3006 domain-containing protein [Clostridiales bacterium]|nr:DUF3006 domain-containing protein [Clostridiales bacterium]
MKAIIDRFENDFALLELESGKTISVPKEIIPPNAAEGSVLIISCDEKETDKRRREIKEKMNSLFHK